MPPGKKVTAHFFTSTEQANSVQKEANGPSELLLSADERAHIHGWAAASETH